MLILCILGANGQVGSCLVALCRTRGIQHVPVARSMLDVTDAQAVARYFDRHHDFDCVINAAAYTDVDGAETAPQAAMAVNHQAVAHVAQACQQHGMVLIHLSTDYVFDGTQRRPYQASDATSPISVYGHSKAQGELAAQLCENAIVLRLSWVYSATGHNFLKTMLKLMQEKSRICVVADQYGAPTSAASIARAILTICVHQYRHAATASQCAGIYHYSDSPATTWYDYACYIYQQAKTMAWPVRPCTLEAIPSEGYVTVAQRPTYSVFCLEKIKGAFGIEPGCWQDEVRAVMRVMQLADRKVTN
jgi:dTDP-4-dehydrorhamnose reductase